MNQLLYFSFYFSRCNSLYLAYMGQIQVKYVDNVA